MSKSPFSELQRLNLSRALVVTSMMQGYHGSPLVAIDVGLTLRAMGVQVDFFCLDIQDPLLQLMRDLGLRCFDPKRRPGNIFGSQYDLVWAQHWPAYGFAFFELQIRARYIVLACLSSFEPLESLSLMIDSANCFAFNSESTHRQILEGSAGALSRIPAVITHNGLAPSWFSGTKHCIDSHGPRSVVVISNHVPSEIREAASTLTSKGIEVRLIGVQDEPLLVDPRLIDNFDVVCTIGHSVQKALSRKKATFCYDRFGGPGYLTLNNFRAAEAQNFSGRCTPVAKSPDQIAEEIFTEYYSVTTAAEKLYALAKCRFSLEVALMDIFKVLPTEQIARIVLRPKTSTDRKMVRFAVNQIVGYELFTPYDAIMRGKTLLRLINDIHISEELSIILDIDVPGRLYTASLEPRVMPVYITVWPIIGVTVSTVISVQEDGSEKSVAWEDGAKLQFPFVLKNESSFCRLSAVFSTGDIVGLATIRCEHYAGRSLLQHGRHMGPSSAG